MIDLRNVRNIYIGNKPITKMYLGNELVWIASTPEQPEVPEEPPVDEPTAYDNFVSAVQADGGTVEDYHFEQYSSLKPNVKQSGNVVIVPGAYKTGVIYGIKTDTGEFVAFPFNRNATSNYRDEFGVVLSASINTPRIDYDTNGSVKGYLLEKQSTNLLLKSRVFNSATWLKGSSGSGYQSPGLPAVITVDYAIAPNGLQEAYRIQLNRGSTGRSGIYQGITATANNTYTSSIFVKPLDGTTIEQLVSLSNFGAFLAGSDISKRTRYAVSYANGWYRIVTKDTVVTPSGATFRLQITSTDPIQTLDCLVWECQFEAGSEVTSPIHTESSTVTRPADVISGITATTTSSVYTNVNTAETINDVQGNVTVLPGSLKALSLFTRTLSQSEKDSIVNPPPTMVYNTIKSTGFPIGMMTKDGVLNSSARKAVIQNECHAVVLENLLKPGNTVKAIAADGTITFDFSKSDVELKYYKSIGVKVHSHCGAWPLKMPTLIVNFIKAPTTTVAMAEYVCKQMMQAHLLHCKADPLLDGVVESFDPWNEIFLDSGKMVNGAKYKANVFIDKCGEDIIRKGFVWASQADSRVKLFLNDYDWQYGWRKLTAWIGLYQSIKASNPNAIHGLGLQFHTDVRVTDSAIATYLKQIGDTGAEVHISEIGIMANVTGRAEPFIMTESETEALAKKQEKVVIDFMKLPPSQQFGVKWWGMNHKYYWKLANSSKLDYPMLLENTTYAHNRSYDYVLRSVKAAKGLT